MFQHNRLQNLGLACCLLWFTASGFCADDDLGKRASWSPLSAPEVKTRLDQWLGGRTLDDVTKLKIETLWPEQGGPQTSAELLDQVAVTIALVDPTTRPLVDLCRGTRTAPTAPSFAFLSDDKQPPFVRHNLRLYYARWLAQHDLYDEASMQLDGIQPADVIDPASLLFYQSVGFHRLLEKDKCLPLLDQLLENRGTIPRRYETLAELMLADLRPLKPDSLDEIARLMDDIRRRQQLYRSGKVVRDEEEKVLAKLDKIIDEMEKNAGQGGAGGGPGGSQPATPMNDSNPGGGTGPGNVDPKKHDRDSNWGDLPPKERAAAMAELAKDLPAHYREVIEEYFRKLARDEPR